MKRLIIILFATILLLSVAMPTLAFSQPGPKSNFYRSISKKN